MSALIGQNLTAQTTGSLNPRESLLEDFTTWIESAEGVIFYPQ